MNRAMASVAIRDIREEVKQYIDRADAKLVKMIHAMLSVDADTESHWWTSMPDNIRAEVEASLSESERGEVMSHEEVMQKYPQWFTR